MCAHMQVHSLPVCEQYSSEKLHNLQSLFSSIQLGQLKGHRLHQQLVTIGLESSTQTDHRWFLIGRLNNVTDDEFNRKPQMIPVASL